MAWIHEEYPEGRIKDYVNGVEHDLENVTANEGHDLVKDSILEQTKRIADIAVHNTRYRKENFTRSKFLWFMETAQKPWIRWFLWKGLAGYFQK